MAKFLLLSPFISTLYGLALAQSDKSDPKVLSSITEVIATVPIVTLPPVAVLTPSSHQPIRLIPLTSSSSSPPSSERHSALAKAISSPAAEASTVNPALEVYTPMSQATPWQFWVPTETTVKFRSLESKMPPSESQFLSIVFPSGATPFTTTAASAAATGDVQNNPAYGVASTASSPTPTDSANMDPMALHKSNPSGIIIAGIISGVAILLCFAIIGFLLVLERRKRRRAVRDCEGREGGASASSSTMDIGMRKDSFDEGVVTRPTFSQFVDIDLKEYEVDSDAQSIDSDKTYVEANLSPPRKGKEQ